MYVAPFTVIAGSVDGCPLTISLSEACASATAASNAAPMIQRRFMLTFFLLARAALAAKLELLELLRNAAPDRPGRSP